mgnify:CR=1 FL=1
MADSERISGANSDSLIIKNAIPADSGNYSCRITVLGSEHAVESQIASVTVKAIPKLIYHSPSGTIAPGKKLVLSVVAEGDDLFYTWLKDNLEVQAGTKTEYIVESVTLGDGGDYYCIIGNPCGSVKSACMEIIVSEGGITSSENTNNEEYVLSSPIPNPVKSQARIGYSVPSGSQIQVILRDIQGKEITVLYETNATTGVGSFIIDADLLRLAAGTYYYTLQSGDISITEKLVITR